MDSKKISIQVQRQWNKARQKKLARIKAQILNGAYEINTNNVAKSMLMNCPLSP